MINLDFLNNKDFGKYKPEQIENTNVSKLMEVVFAIGKKYEPNFVIEKGSSEEKLYQNLIYYFTDNEKCYWNLSKGLFLSGKKGVGKSICLKIINTMYRCGADIPPMQRKKYFSIVGMEGLCVKENRELKNLESFYMKTKGNLFCDEVMRESNNEYKQINNFGTIEQPFSIGIHQMYRNFCDDGKLYHFTTNYWTIESHPNGKLLSDIYGSEIHDRILEMCNIINITGSSKRK